MIGRACNPAIAMATGLSTWPLTPDEARWLERYF
jgi:hypothetical protein